MNKLRCRDCPARYTCEVEYYGYNCWDEFVRWANMEAEE